MDGFLRVDALSALIIGLNHFVRGWLAPIYAVGYLRADVRAGRITDGQLRQYYVLTPLFRGRMLLVPLADIWA